MQKTVRYYIQKSGEQPSLRAVPVTDRRTGEVPRRADEPRPVAAATPVRRLREALKRSVR